MRKLYLILAALIIIMLIILLVFSCCLNGDDDTNFTGDYCLYVEQDMPMFMHIVHNGSTASFDLVTPQETIHGSGSVSGQQMDLFALMHDGELTMLLVFAADGQSFTGDYSVTGSEPGQGTVTGDKGDCTNNLPDYSNLPDITVFNQTKSDTFVVPLSQLGNLVAGVAPMPGNNSSCYHGGAHVVFTATSQLQTVDIIAPVDGVISMIDKCFTYANGLRDQYKIHFAYAQHNDQLFNLELAIEPMADLQCSNGNPEFFTPYIHVVHGDQVSKGQKIGEMVLIPGYQAHIHMNSKFQGIFMCPDIFNTTVIDYIDDYYNGIPDTCNGAPYGGIAAGTICYEPGAGESHDDY